LAVGAGSPGQMTDAEGSVLPERDILIAEVGAAVVRAG
jgi:hypothetical protein